MKKEFILLFIILILIIGVQAKNNPIVTSLSPSQAYEATQQNLTITIENQETDCDSAIDFVAFTLHPQMLPDGYYKSVNLWTTEVTGDNVLYRTSSAPLNCGFSTGSTIKYGINLETVNIDTEYNITIGTQDLINDTQTLYLPFTILNDSITPTLDSLSPLNYGFVKNETREFLFTFTESESGLKTTETQLGYDDNTEPLNNGVVAGTQELTCSRSSNQCSTQLNLNGFYPYLDFRLIGISDTAGNSIDQGTTFPYHIFIDNAEPTVELSQPENLLETNEDYLDLEYDTTDNSFDADSSFDPTLDCSLVVDSEIISTDTVTEADSTISVETDFSEADDGTHTWYSYCTDKAGYTTSTETRSILLDRQGPEMSIAIEGINDGDILPQTTISLNVVDELHPVDSVWYNYGDSDIFITEPYEIDATELADDTYTFDIYAADTLGNENNIELTFTIDTTPPEIENLEPETYTIFNNTAQFTYTAIDNHAETITCEIDIDGNEELQGEVIDSRTITSEEEQSFYYVLIDGIHNYGLECTDSVGNKVRDGTRQIIIDDTKPNLEIVKPADQQRFDYNAPYIIYNTSDTYGVNKCELYINNELNQTDETIIDNENSHFDMNWTEGSSIWNIACTDSNGNIQTSEIRTINIDTIIPTTELNINPNPAEYQTDNIEIDWNVNDLNKDYSIIELFYPNNTLYISSTNETANISINKLKLYTVGDYSVHIFGNDSVGNSVDTYENLTITDTTEPAILTSNPSSGTTLTAGISTALFELTTDETALCRYSNQYTEWNNMTQMNYTNTNIHNQTINNLDLGNTYNYYFLCEDINTNRMILTHNITFSTQAQQNQNNGGGGGGGGGGNSNTQTPQITNPQEIVTPEVIEQTPEQPQN